MTRLRDPQGARRASPLTAVLCTALLVATLLVAPGLAAPASAAPGADTGGGGGDTSHQSGFTGSRGQSCFMYANSSGFGTYCPTSGEKLGESETIATFLGVDEVKLSELQPELPECWNDDLPQTAQSGDIPQDKKRYVKICIENYDDLDLKEDTVGDIEFSTSYVLLLPWEVIYLPPEYEELIEAAEESSTFPETFLEVRPEDAARVNSDTRFFMKIAGASNIRPGEIQYMDPIESEGVQMRAYLHTLEVFPEGEGPEKPRVECHGASIMAADAATKESSPNSCWHVYERSSASQEDGVYKARAYAYWQVQYSRDGGSTWTNFPEGTPVQDETLVRRGGTTRVPVRDVQTLVVP